MKTLIIYYSRTGITKKVAEKIKEKLNADIEEIKDTINRQGAIGYLKSGKEAMQEKPAKIEELKSDLSAYELIIIGTPIWGFNMSSPIRALLVNYKDKFPQVALFATQGGNGADKALEKMGNLINKKPVANLILLTKDVVTENFENKVDEFIKKLN